MSDWDEFDDGNQEGSDLLKDLRSQLKDKAKRERELSEQLAGLEAKVRERTVADVLSTKGVPAKVARLVPADIGADEDAVGKWLEDYKDLFGTSEEKPDTESTEQPSGESTVPAEAQAAMTKVAQTGASGVIPQSGYQEQLDKVRTATPEELLAMIAEAQQGAAA